jgi:uncharacterized protein YegP (UPF0339 family)
MRPRGSGAFEVYVDSAAEWRWRFWAPNGRKMADSGEGYKRRQDCVDAINRLCAEAKSEASIIG